MLISELDLCKREWLELVFANRNKQYGAYELRSTSNNITAKALGITLGVAIALSTVFSYASIHQPEDPIVMTDIPIGPPPVIEKKDKVLEKPKLESKQAQAKPLATNQPAIKMQIFPPMVVVPDKFAEDIKPLEEGVAVGPVDAPGTVNAVNAGGTGTSESITEGTGNGDGDKPFDAVEVMPQPMGGDAAWAKFLQKNLRYPAIARENDQSGRVFISFIVERDGKLSDIQVIRKAGFGFDEEALRVLKMAPAWKPGIQNGSAVRVRFTVPINFQLATE